MAWPHAGEARLLPRRHTPEEGLHGLVQPEVDFRQELAIDMIDGWVVLAALGQCLLGYPPVPALARAEPHHPPVAEAATLGLLIISKVAASCSLTCRRIFLALSMRAPMDRKYVLLPKYSTPA